MTTGVFRVGYIPLTDAFARIGNGPGKNSPFRQRRHDTKQSVPLGQGRGSAGKERARAGRTTAVGAGRSCTWGPFAYLGFLGGAGPINGPGVIRNGLGVSAATVFSSASACAVSPARR